jgi:hypothetical protein
MSIISGGAMVIGGEMVIVGVCSMYLQHYIKVISLVQKGRDYSEEDQRNLDRESSPKMRMALFH